MTTLSATLAGTGVALLALTAAGAQVREEIAVDRAALQSDRQAIVAANLPLTEEQAKMFWPLYRDYRAELAKLGDRAVELVIDYAKNFETLSETQAALLLDEHLAIQRDEIRIKLAWVPKFRKVLPSKAVTRFYQIENKLDALLRFDAADQIPLVESATP